MTTYFEADEALARRLVDAQFRQWADRPLRRLRPGGSDHVIFRLGEDLTVRLPRHDGAVGQAATEARWLHRLAPRLPLEIPRSMGVGRPGFGYPWPWAVSGWLDGEVATPAQLGGSDETAKTLAGFLLALQAFEAADADVPGTGLDGRDRDTRAAIAEVAGHFDAEAMTAVWEEALAAPAWDGPPVWFHGDFHTGNLLTRDGRISAVLDFGGLGRGDPSRDLTVAFTLLTAPARAVFRDALGVDDATWSRGRGYALSGGVRAYASYAATDARVAAQTTRQITEILFDSGAGR